MKTVPKLRHWVVYKFALVGILLVGFLDISTGRFIGVWLARFIFCIIPKERRLLPVYK